MNISKKTVMPHIAGSLVDSSQPVVAIPFRTGNCESFGIAHSHKRAQFIYPGTGIVKVQTGYGIWCISPSQAAWIPSMHEHRILYPQNTTVYALFIDSSLSSKFKNYCCVLNIDSFMKELILKAVKIGEKYSVGSHEHSIMQVISGEISRLTPSSLNLPLAKDERVLRVMNYLLDNPASSKQLDHFSKIACTSTKNLNRLFMKETRLTFGTWRKHLKVLEAVEKLSKGLSVTEVSIDLGYRSLSSFVSMFRKVTGKTPGAFLREHSCQVNYTENSCLT
jgi:AraC-like DNA-binding protein